MFSLEILIGIIALVILSGWLYLKVKVFGGDVVYKGMNLSNDTKAKLTKIFIEPSEEYVSSLGNWHITNYLEENDLEHGFSIISNKRVYVKGKFFHIKNGKISKKFEERTVDLNVVTGTSYMINNPIPLLLSALVSLIACIGCCFLSYVAKAGTLSTTLLAVGIILFIMYGVFLGLYFTNCQKLFHIHLDGEGIAFAKSLYDKSELADFQNQLNRVIDRKVASTSVPPIENM